ncbi:MAG: GNAT family N-acetyltransferase [Hyphomicrobiaceae bacterium]
MSTEFEIRPATESDLPAIANLHARAFGPGRFARTAYRVREGQPDVTPNSRAAFLNGALVAALHATPVTIGGTSRALLIGPVAVEPAEKGRKYGQRLIAQALEDAAADGFRIALLVGDQPYYGRFGFAPVPPGKILMPGPVDPHRLLARELIEGALAEFSGLVAAT